MNYSVCKLYLSLKMGRQIMNQVRGVRMVVLYVGDSLGQAGTEGLSKMQA